MHRLFFLLLSLNFAVATAQTLATTKDVSVSAQDLQAELLKAPSEVRANVLNRPEQVLSIVSNLLVRRVLATQAKQAGLDQVTEVKTALALARDRVLSDARLDQLDRTDPPDRKALESYAHSIYKKDPKRFEMPEEIRVRHILLRSTQPEARAEAQDLLAKLKTGADFAELAKAKSQDPGSAAKGGDLGFFARGRMVGPFEDAAFGLKEAGAVSEVVETTFGFHIIKLEARRPAGIRSFDEVKETMVREAQATLINNRRKAEEDRILATAKVDQEAIAAYARTQAK